MSFTKRELRGAYNLIRMAKGEEWKTAFHSRFGFIKYKVMPFMVTNAPASFPLFINDILHEYLDIFWTASMGDILVYSDSPKEHQTQVRLVLDALQKAGLYLKHEKCEFHVQGTK